MNNRQKAAAAWLVFSLTAIAACISALYNLANLSGGYTLYDVLDIVLVTLQPVTFALVGALIISRSPGNVIGLLLLILPVALTTLGPIETYLATRQPDPAAIPTAMEMIALWFNSWNWLLLVMPILFILVLFPTGRPFTPRWRWLIVLGLGLSAALITFSTLGAEISTDYGVFANPIGFLSMEQLERYITIPFILSMIVLLLGCPASLYVRYRRTNEVEREQIKWLIYAGALFATAFIFAMLTGSQEWSSWGIVPFELSVLAIPIAIGIAILRYRLYDIDIIIRRTLQYGLLTAVLVAVYLGLVLLTQAAFVQLTGQESPLAIVISTLVIAALFNPLRRRIQSFIDRRFYRRSYDPAVTLAQFAQTARDEVEIEHLALLLISTVDETMQPESAVLWLASESAAAANPDQPRS